MWTFTADFEAYAHVAEPFLATDPVGNTVPLTVLAGLRSGRKAEGGYYGWWSVDGVVRGAAFRTPPTPLGLASMPVEAVEPLIESLHRDDHDVPEVMGPVTLVEDFVARWPGDVAHVRSERLYRLGTLSAPEVEGAGRVATDAELPLMVSWFEEFGEEAGFGRNEDSSPEVERRMARGDVVVWEVAGEPVSMAALSPAAAGVRQIGPVYTPPPRRRRGYGTAVSAFASAAALAGGCEQVVLFADLANPTSNTIYQAIGYEPAADYAHIVFDPVL